MPGPKCERSGESQNASQQEWMSGQRETEVRRRTLPAQLPGEPRLPRSKDENTPVGRPPPPPPDLLILNCRKALPHAVKFAAGAPGRSFRHRPFGAEPVRRHLRRNPSDGVVRLGHADSLFHDSGHPLGLRHPPVRNYPHLFQASEEGRCGAAPALRTASAGDHPASALQRALRGGAAHR